MSLHFYYHYTHNPEDFSQEEAYDAISCSSNLLAWAEPWMCEVKVGLLGGGLRLNSLDALPVLHQYLKYEPDDYTALAPYSLYFPGCTEG